MSVHSSESDLHIESGGEKKTDSETFRMAKKHVHEMDLAATEQFVSTHFRLRRCRRYVQVNLETEPLTPGERRLFDEDDCVCGKSKKWHLESQAHHMSPTRQDFYDAFINRPWSMDEDTALFPCNTFGRLTFRAGDGVDSSEILPGASAKYIRLDGHNNSPEYLEKVYELMTAKQYWGMRKPGLLMEITGSTSDFSYMDQLKIDRLNAGLLKAAKSADAWIITNGINRGVMKLVGEAVAQTKMAHIDRSITCLGIGSWGTVKYRGRLEQRVGGRASTSSRTPPNQRSRRTLPLITRAADQEMVPMIDVEHQQQLKAQITSQAIQGNWSVDYDVDNKDDRGKTYMALDQNHNYFLLVDNGRDKRFGEEISFRARLIDHISKKKLPGSGTVSYDPGIESATPSLLIVIGGGETALRTVEETLAALSHQDTPESDKTKHVTNARPVIVLPGFGGVADLIAYAYEITEDKTELLEDKKKAKPKMVKHKSTFDFPNVPPSVKDQQHKSQKASVFHENFDKIIREHPEMQWLVKTIPEKEKDKKIDRFIKIIRACLDNRKMITVLKISNDTHDNKEHLDSNLLEAIFKAELGSPSAMLELAQIWDRDDFAKEILNDHASLIKRTMNCKEAMLRAICNGQSKFCKLFDDYNLVDTKKFVTRSVMSEIYYRGEEEEEIKRDEFLKVVGNILAAKVGCYVDNFFTEDIVPIIGKSRHSDEEDLQEEEIDAAVTTISKALPGISLRKRATTKSVSEQQQDEKVEDVMNTPYISGMRDLFLFALLIESREMAIALWGHGRDHLGTALFAARFLLTLSRDAEQSGLIDLAVEYETSCKSWQKRVLDVLTVCYEDNPDRTNRLLTRTLATWQNYTVLEIAYHANQQEFMGHPAVQTKINQLWNGRIAPFTNLSLVYLSALCWPFVFKVKFVAEDDGLSRHDHDAHNNAAKAATPSQHTSSSELSQSKHYAGVRGCWPSRRPSNKREIPFLNALYYVYSCPQMKFVIHSLTILLSLLAFSYFIISGPKRTRINGLEIYLWTWATAILIDKLKVSFGEELLNHFHEKLTFFFAYPWNWPDVVGTGCLACAFCIRLTRMEEQSDDAFLVLRTTYALACLFYWIKAFHIFYVTQELGPKVITLFKMLNDMYFFLMLYAVLLISFSVPIYALTFPERPLQSSFAKDITTLLAILYNRWWTLAGITMDEARNEVEGIASYCPAKGNATSRVTSIVQLVKRSLPDSEIFENESNVTSSVFSGTFLTRDDEIADEVEEQSSFNPCPERNFVAIFLFVIYLMITNIMLLNMLIAMLTRTVEAVRLHSIRIWRFHIYRIAYEHYGKAVLPSPFMLFELAYGLVRYIMNGAKTRHQNSAIKEYFSANDFEYQKLSLFERSATVDLVEAEIGRTEEEAKSAIISRLKVVHQKLNRKLDMVEARIGDLANRNEQGQATDSD